MRKFLIFIGMMMVGSPVWAAMPTGGDVTKVAHVNGLVCDFCAQAISQAIKLKPGVEAVDIDLDSKTVTLKLADGSPLTDDKTLADLLHEAGYDMTSVDTK